MIRLRTPIPGTLLLRHYLCSHLPWLQALWAQFTFAAAIPVLTLTLAAGAVGAVQAGHVCGGPLFVVHVQDRQPHLTAGSGARYLSAHAVSENQLRKHEPPCQ